MFSNLNAEMGRAKLSIKSLSELTGINYETLKLKFRGVTEFKLCEMVEIKRKAFPDKTLGGRREDKREKKRTKNKMAENHQRNGVRDLDRRRNRTCI